VADDGGGAASVRLRRRAVYRRGPPRDRHRGSGGWTSARARIRSGVVRGVDSVERQDDLDSYGRWLGRDAHSPRLDRRLGRRGRGGGRGRRDDRPDRRRGGRRPVRAPRHPARGRSSRLRRSPHAASAARRAARARSGSRAGAGCRRASRARGRCASRPARRDGRDGRGGFARRRSERRGSVERRRSRNRSSCGEGAAPQACPRKEGRYVGAPRPASRPRGPSHTSHAKTGGAPRRLRGGRAHGDAEAPGIRATNSAFDAHRGALASGPAAAFATRHGSPDGRRAAPAVGARRRCAAGASRRCAPPATSLRSDRHHDRRCDAGDRS
jgi:hypothetical protein